MAKKLKYITESIDKNTGEVSLVTKTFAVKIPHEENFFFIFPEGTDYIYTIKGVVDIRVLFLLCSHVEFNSGKIYITSSLRNTFQDSLGISKQSFSNSITRLKKDGILHGSKGVYEINPRMFWKGTTDTRNKLLKDNKLEIHIKFKRNEAE